MVREIFGRQPGDPLKDSNVNLAIWWMFMNTTLRAAVHLGKNWHEVKICKELSLKNNRTAFQRNRKADEWSDRNHWHKPDPFPRFEVGIDKHIAQPSLSKCHCQSIRLLRLCDLLGENGTRSFWVLEEANSLVFRKRLPQRIESNWSTTYGIRVEDFSRIRYSENPQWDSTDDGKITVWTRELHRQDHLHVNVQWHCTGCKRKWWTVCE